MMDSDQLADKVQEKMMASATPEELASMCRQDHGRKPTPDKVLLSLKGAPVLLRNGITVITGQAGSRKSTLLGLITAGLLADVQPFSSEVNGLKLAYFDTEMDSDDSVEMSQRINRLAGREAGDNSPDFLTYELRPIGYELRVKVIEAVIAKENPDVVIVDGLTDLIADVNSAEESTAIIQRLLQWCSLGICMVVVVHENQSTGGVESRVRGHVGSEVLRKCSLALSVSPEKGETYSKVTSRKNRKLPPPTFYIAIRDGLPEVLHVDEDSFTEERKKADRGTERRNKAEDFFRSIMKQGETVGYSTLVREIMRNANVREDAAKKRIAYAVSAGVIEKNNVGSYYLPYADPIQGEFSVSVPV